jgi:hypothetical protein
MKIQTCYILFIVILLNSCVSEFIPETHENMEMFVVEGLITDNPEADTVKLSKSVAVGQIDKVVPVQGANVMIEDDLGNIVYLNEITGGKYVTDPDEFRGIIGRKYKLRILTNGISDYNYTYESYPVELKPVPPVNAVYYEKTVIEEASEGVSLKEGCQVYLDSFDSGEGCRFYKWDYQETWEIFLPFDIENKTCWVSENSGNIEVKNTSTLSENRINKMPVVFISNNSDRLIKKYSVLVNQYSLNEDEYNYWNKVKVITENVGSLYDITPASVRGNIFCLEDPQQVVLGYFSVSAKTSKRIFIDDSFSGLFNPVKDCIDEKLPSRWQSPLLNISIWNIIDCGMCRPPYYAYTYKKSCADCTARGTKDKPSWWID